MSPQTAASPQTAVLPPPAAHARPPPRDASIQDARVPRVAGSTGPTAVAPPQMASPSAPVSIQPHAHAIRGMVPNPSPPTSVSALDGSTGELRVTPNGSPPLATTLSPFHVEVKSLLRRMDIANEQTWVRIGDLAISMGMVNQALNAFVTALRYNPYSVHALTQAGALARTKEMYPDALEYFRRVTAIDPENGEIWGALGHSYLMVDQLEAADHAYRCALKTLPDPNEPKLWYGIGILEERSKHYASAKEAFLKVLRLNRSTVDATPSRPVAGDDGSASSDSQPGSEPTASKELIDKQQEIYYRLAMITKEEGDYESCIDYLKKVLMAPPAPVSVVDCWFNLGLVYELQNKYDLAKDAYARVLKADKVSDGQYSVPGPGMAYVFQSIAHLYQIPGTGFTDIPYAIKLLEKSIALDEYNYKTHLMLGECYIALSDHKAAHSALTNALAIENSDPAIYLSLAMVHVASRKFLDATNAFFKAITLNPRNSSAWLALARFYEADLKRLSDAYATYHHCLRVDPTNSKARVAIRLMDDEKNKEQPISASKDCPGIVQLESMLDMDKTTTPHPRENVRPGYDTPPVKYEKGVAPENGASRYAQPYRQAPSAPVEMKVEGNSSDAQYHSRGQRPDEHYHGYPRGYRDSRGQYVEDPRYMEQYQQEYMQRGPGAYEQYPANYYGSQPKSSSWIPRKDSQGARYPEEAYDYGYYGYPPGYAYHPTPPIAEYHPGRYGPEVQARYPPGTHSVDYNAAGFYEPREDSYMTYDRYGAPPYSYREYDQAHYDKRHAPYGAPSAHPAYTQASPATPPTAISSHATPRTEYPPQSVPSNNNNKPRNYVENTKVASSNGGAAKQKKKPKRS